jgi:hypothetical protein
VLLEKANIVTTIDSAALSLGTGFYSAVSTGNWSLLPDVLHPEATWTFPGDNVISGTAHGIDEIIDKAVLIGSYGVSIQLEYLMQGRSSFILKLHNTARRGSLVLDEHLATVCTVRDGLIATADTHLSDIAGMNAFFVPVPEALLA